uniref:Uncharacterized protein n=1 Tax=Myoviridae sp. cte0t5 TaxID=2823549 RepID=A0A8S5LH43_9CAUD|nr:MAG TPA: hypothetical protein [Myoviridae sp. cte0t5]
MRYPVSWEALQAREGLSGRRRRGNKISPRVATTSWNSLQGRAGLGQLNQPIAIIWVTEWTGGTLATWLVVGEGRRIVESLNSPKGRGSRVERPGALR